MATEDDHRALEMTPQDHGAPGDRSMGDTSIAGEAITEDARAEDERAEDAITEDERAEDARVQPASLSLDQQAPGATQVRSRLAVYGISAALILAALSPALREEAPDSFPFSDFPMFSHGRPTPMMEIPQALGVYADGRREPLPPLISSGNRETMQSLSTLWQIVRSPDPLRACLEIAARVHRDPARSEMIGVEIALSRFDSIAYFDQEPAPLDRRVITACETSP